jgi:hypothetical protein
MRRFWMIACKMMVLNCAGFAVELEKLTGWTGALARTILVMTAVGLWKLNEWIRDEVRKDDTR